MRLDFENSLGYLIQDVARLMRVVFDRRMKEIGLTRAQWSAVVALRREDGLTQQQLADQMEMERAAMSKLLSRLETGGWVERRADPSDKRVNRIYLSDKFESIWPQVEEHALALRELTFGHLRDEERTLLLAALKATRSELQRSICNKKAELT